MSAFVGRLWQRVRRTPDFGVAGILVLEIIVLSLATVRTVPLSGAAAGRAVARELVERTGGTGTCGIYHNPGAPEIERFTAELERTLARLAPAMRTLDLGPAPFSTAAIEQLLAPHTELVAVVAPFAAPARNTENALAALGRDIPVLAPGNTRVSLFLDWRNLLDVARAFSFIAIAAVGACAVIISGGIDLSVGSLIGLSGVVVAYTLKVQNEPLAVCILAGLAAGTLGGLLNGLLIARLRPRVGTTLAAVVVIAAATGLLGARWGGWSVPLAVSVAAGAAPTLFVVQRYFLDRVTLPPFIATLGMLSIGRGLAYWITKGQQITSFGSLNEYVGTASWLLVPLPVRVPAPVAVMVWLSLAGALFLTRTVWGRRIYAVGGNETAAHLAGVNVDRVKVMVYTLAGFLAAVSGLLYVARFDYAGSTVGRGYELQVIAACVIGGTSLAGGRGSVVGAVLGAAIMGVLQNGMTLLDVPPDLVDMVIGTIIILAVTIDQMKKRGSVR